MSTHAQYEKSKNLLVSKRKIPLQRKYRKSTLKKYYKFWITDRTKRFEFQKYLLQHLLRNIRLICYTQSEMKEMCLYIKRTNRTFSHRQYHSVLTSWWHHNCIPPVLGTQNGKAKVLERYQTYRRRKKTFKNVTGSHASDTISLFGPSWAIRESSVNAKDYSRSNSC